MSRKWVWLLCGTIFVAELALGVYMSVINGFIYGDALSRAANAFYVLYSRDPHLAAIGFIWNPLPSLLALPILIFRPLHPPLFSSGLPVIIISALFAALTLLVIIRGFAKMGIAACSAGLVCAVLFALNPFQFWYGANGMSEAIFGCFIAISIIAWTEWLRFGHSKPLLISAVALAFALLTRYEAIPYAAALTAATVVSLYGRRTTLRKIESSIIVLLVPIMFAFGTWIWLNYTIMGDPLYFLRSSYSNLGQSAFLEVNEVFRGIIRNPVASFIYVVERLAVFLIPYGVLAGIQLISPSSQYSVRRADFISFSLLVFSIPCFQWYMVMSGSSYGWLRFFYYPLLITAAWLPYELSFKGVHHHFRFKQIALVAAFAVSALLLIPVMNNPVYAPEEYTAIHYQDSDLFHKLNLNRMNAKTVDEDIFLLMPESLVLTDSFNAFEIIISSRFPERFVNTTDRDFNTVLSDPLKYGANYILVPYPEGLNLLNAVLHRYPGLYEGKLGWVKLERELEGKWRLFRVVGSPPEFNSNNETS